MPQNSFVDDNMIIESTKEAPYQDMLMENFPVKKMKIEAKDLKVGLFENPNAL